MEYRILKNNIFCHRRSKYKQNWGINIAIRNIMQ